MFYSFDIFDTLITRKTCTPQGVFLIVQDKLKKCTCFSFSDDLLHNYAAMRINAEVMAQRIYKKDVTLNEIYNTLSLINNIDSETIKYLKNLEVLTEKENIIGVTENIVFLKQVKNEGDSVCLISDMYLPIDVIQDVLLSVDSVFADIPILVSCEYNKSKAKGDLYSFFLNEFSIDVSNWTHIGDNYESDVKRVIGLGGKAIQFKNNKKYSLLIDDINTCKNKLNYQVILGAIKNSLSVAKSLYYNVGAAVAGPILYGYVLWVLTNALKFDIKDLFFYARDGYLLKLIADEIIKVKHFPISIHYLYGSRKTWSVGCDGDIEEYIKYKFETAELNALSHVVAVFDITFNELESYLGVGISPKKRNEALSDFEKLFVKHKLLFNKQFINKVQNKRQQLKDNVLQYLKQEIPLEGKIAFVDIKGHGPSQKFMKNLLLDINVKKLPITAFYYKFYPNQNFLPSENVFYTYCYEDLPINRFLEVIARAPHGQTIDYKQLQSNFWVPCFSPEKDYLDNSLFKDYESGIKKYTQEMLASYSISVDEHRKFAADLLIKLGTQPDKRMQDFIGDMPFEFDSSGNVKMFAPKLSDSDIETICNDSHFDYKGCCIDFSLLRLNKRQRNIVKNHLNKSLSKNMHNHNYYNALQINKRIVIYGAGKRGQRFYREFIARNDVKVPLIVDKNADNIKLQNITVQPVSAIKTIEFDYVLITVANSAVRNEILQDLLDMGVKREKIIF